MFKFVFLGLELIEIIVALAAIGFCFYLFCEFVLPFFTFGAIKPGWLFFSKWSEKKKAKEAAKYDAEKTKFQETEALKMEEQRVTEENPEPVEEQPTDAKE